MEDSGESRFGSLVERNTTIRDAISLMASRDSNRKIAGFAVVVDEQKRVLGVLTDGDVRRALIRGVTVESRVDEVANFRPLVFDRTLSKAVLRQRLLEEGRRKSGQTLPSKVLLVEPDGTFFDVVMSSEVLQPKVEEQTIAIYGLGFVGLTLAATLANTGLSVVGIDSNISVVDDLKRGIAPFFEKGLDSLLLSVSMKGTIEYSNDPASHPADVHIVTVGTPVSADGRPDLASVKSVTRTIAGLLKLGDMVIYRSTLPVGTMRNVVLPDLERSGLSAGIDFGLAFAPERTLEGKALEELKSLPQIVGGVDQLSTYRASAVFRLITTTIVEVESLEAAEMVKLANNTFRDLIFAFANEVAYMCDDFNINAFALIQAANEGYPRDAIPAPSPGVGGACLTKDPYLFSFPILEPSRAPTLGVASRAVHNLAPSQVVKKIESFCVSSAQEMDRIKILLVGVAFKGIPETSDTRGSLALDLLRLLPNSDITLLDFVVPRAEIAKLHSQVAEGELREIVGKFDAVLFLNNHHRNVEFNVVEAFGNRLSPILLFDGWNQFDRREMESLPQLFYSTLGYITKNR